MEHINSCKEKIKQDEDEKASQLKKDRDHLIKFYTDQIESIQNQFEQKISNLNEQTSNLEKQLYEKDIFFRRQIDEKLNEKNEYIAKLEAKLEKFEDAVISSKKPTNTTNNNIVVANTLNLNDTERFKAIIEEKLTKNVVCNGQRGLAKFAVENLLKDSEGKLMYKCVDPSRHNFEFTNSDGIVEKDVKAIKLKRALIEGDVIVKAKNAGNELWTREDGSMDNDRYTASSGQVMEIMTVDRDDTKFRTELSALTS
jgi:DNA repair exonuclease SbcCD ATPase subunit